MPRKLLDVRIRNLIRFLVTLSGVKHLKREHPLNLRRRRIGQHPGRIEILNRLQAWNNRGFQPGRREYDEIMSESGIRRFIHRKIQIEINECRHQVSFTRAHRQAEQIIRIGHVGENVLEYSLIFNAVRIRENGAGKLIGNTISL